VIEQKNLDCKGMFRKPFWMGTMNHHFPLDLKNFLPCILTESHSFSFV